MITSKVAALWSCVAIYDQTTPGFFDSIHYVGCDTVGLIHQDSVLHIVVAGTQNAKGWLEDFSVDPMEHPVLGTVHGGFYGPAVSIFDDLRPLMTGKVSVMGHSRGAALAAAIAALCVLEGIPVEQVFMFAPPRLGMRKCADWFAAHLPQAMAWRNGLDPVPEVPPPLFVDVVPLMRIHVQPGGFDDINPFAYHSGHLYVAGVV